MTNENELDSLISEFPELNSENIKDVQLEIWEHDSNYPGGLCQWQFRYTLKDLIDDGWNINEHLISELLKEKRAFVRITSGVRIITVKLP
mgnify:CR=1 FL=1